MPQSLIELLPEITSNGRQKALGILENCKNGAGVPAWKQGLVLPRSGADRSRNDGIKKHAIGQWLNHFLHGDNLAVMQVLLAGDAAAGIPCLMEKIDLIYIDPPFDSSADYRAKIRLPDGSAGHEPAVMEQFAYSDIWEQGTASYLEMLYVRLVLMKELLSNEGSIYVHIDWHAGHYVKLLLDDIFGKDNFVNEIIWCYQGTGEPHKAFKRKHDTIFFYRKGDNYIFNAGSASEPISEFSKSKYTKSDEKGAYKEIRHSNGKVFRQYQKETMRLRDVWDIPVINAVAAERLDFSTQKPQALLERIIAVSSNEGSIVADFFGGSGTAAAAAEKLRRRWVFSDVGSPACMISRKRLAALCARPFFCHALGTGENADKAVIKIKEPRLTLPGNGRALLEIELDGYELLPGALPAVDKKSRQLKKSAMDDPLALIDYWAIDPDYDGKVFFPLWQDFRELRDKAKPFFDAVKFAPERVKAFIHSVLDEKKLVKQKNRGEHSR